MAHPTLWSTALRMWARTTPADWWRRPPFLPVPDRGYVRFRLETAYGRVTPPAAHDLLAYLRWCREYEIVRRGRREA